jgi:hypothetical protein
MSLAWSEPDLCALVVSASIEISLHRTGQPDGNQRGAIPAIFGGSGWRSSWTEIDVDTIERDEVCPALVIVHESDRVSHAGIKARQVSGVS